MKMCCFFFASGQRYAVEGYILMYKKWPVQDGAFVFSYFQDVEWMSANLEGYVSIAHLYICMYRFSR